MAFCTVFRRLKDLRPKGIPWGSSDELHKACNRTSSNHSYAGSKTIWPQHLWPQPASQRNSSLCEKMPEYRASAGFLPHCHIWRVHFWACAIYRYIYVWYTDKEPLEKMFCFFFQTPINFGFSTNLSYLTKWVPSYCIKKCCWKKHTVIGRSCQSLCSLKPDAIPLESVELRAD